MRLIDYLDKGASLGTESPCLTMAGRTLNYRDVQEVSWRVARALQRPDRVCLRLRHLSGGCGVVPNQPAQ